MTSRQKKVFRPGLWATVFAVPVFFMLIGLGTWQVYRLQWKLDLIEQIETRAKGPAIPLPEGDVTPEDWRYQHVTVTGTFEHDKEIHLIANQGSGRVGYEIVTPLRRDDGSYVLVDRGWVPTEFRDPATRPEGQVTGEQTITGYLRRSFEKPWAVPANDPAEDLWLYANIAEMEEHMGIEAYPMFVQADDAPNPGGLPMGGQTRLEIPNNHLQYVVTWYGIAIALVVIFVIYHMRPVDEGEGEG